MQTHKLVPTPIKNSKGALVGYNHEQCGYDEGAGRCLMPRDHPRHASMKQCPDCGGSGFEFDDVTRGRCGRCKGRGKTLMTDTQLDSEFPRHEEDASNDDSR